ncbi:helix-turn-helix domain-containing protein [Nocardia cyriacigeorgica]|uniref:helix-turn-helix domain-containing protein n=1 Tax=Nocardia cyriacigeorgica TaxID=135487 RepID=UPI001894C4CC|nr:helix-turn-helix domain-containing protein [Nocardia cyriacigeorgica]MBF6412883.1 helix-turn-helix transcriptional regulator [Nocardia cyriacigeorgica]
MVKAAPIVSAIWLWSSPEAATAISTRDLPTILRTYRRINGHMSQAALADLLGYDNSYVSMLETGRRVIGDVKTRRHIAARLSLPAHVLGVTDADDAEYRAMLQFGDSTVRLAEIARQAGRAVEAVNELWPLVARLEARAAEGHMERDSLVLLAQARVALGVSLGTVLPEERLSSAARWTGQAVKVAKHLDDSQFYAHTLRMHGNELRKAGHPGAAVARLNQSLQLSNDPAEQGGSLAFMCRATGELGNAEQFDTALCAYRELLDKNTGSGLLFQPFTLREIELRGLMGTGRTHDAGRLVYRQVGTPAAPQWHIIERVTTGEVLVAINEPVAATDAFTEAIQAAERHRLPHQIQRTIRATAKAGMREVAEEGQAALKRIRSLLISGT